MEERKIELLHKCTFEVVQTKLCSRIAVFDPSTQILLSSFSVDIIVIGYLHIGQKFKEKSRNINLWNSIFHVYIKECMTLTRNNSYRTRIEWKK